MNNNWALKSYHFFLLIMLFMIIPAILMVLFNLGHKPSLWFSTYEWCSTIYLGGCMFVEKPYKWYHTLLWPALLVRWIVRVVKQRGY